MRTPWKTSNTLIADVKRRISVPIAQETYSDDDILDFANDEMASNQVPNIMEYHEEYFVYNKEVDLEEDVVRYPIPNRAIGMKLRNLFFQDTNGNKTKMVRINPDDQDLYSQNTINFTNNYTFYMEGNDVVLTGSSIPNPTGTLVFSFFLRPNLLVKNESAAVIESFNKEITVDNTGLSANDSVTINDVTFTAVSGTPSSFQFQIGATSVLTTTNLVNSINTYGTEETTGTASNNSNQSAIATINYSDRGFTFSTSNSASFAIATTIGLVSEEDIPDNIEEGGYVDFLQTKPGHRTYSYDILVDNNAISSNVISFEDEDIPDNFVIGDYICTQYECIIPQIPPDLHDLLVERTSAQILASQGDVELLQASDKKVKEMEQRQGDLIDNRVVGSPMKVINRFSALKAGKYNYRNIT